MHRDSIRQADGFVLSEHRVGIDAVVVTLIHARKEQTRSVEGDIADVITVVFHGCSKKRKHIHPTWKVLLLHLRKDS